jgi:hypothetical protein
MDPSTRAILEQGRDVHDPTPEDQARVRAKLVARGAAFTAAGGAAMAMSSGWGLAAKLAVSLVVAGSVGAYMLTRPPPELVAPLSPAAAPAASYVAPEVEPATDRHETRAPSATAEPAPIPPPAAAPHATAATPTGPRAPGPALPHTSTQPAPLADLEAETALVADAQAAIRRGDFATALAKLDAHATSFPNGVLTEERLAARVVALCGLDREYDAKALARSFLARYPTSPLASRVRSSCAAP